MVLKFFENVKDSENVKPMEKVEKKNQVGHKKKLLVNMFCKSRFETILVKVMTVEIPIYKKLFFQFFAF